MIKSQIYFSIKDVLLPVPEASSYEAQPSLVQPTSMTHVGACEFVDMIQIEEQDLPR